MMPTGGRVGDRQTRDKGRAAGIGQLEGLTVGTVAWWSRLLSQRSENFATRSLAEEM